MNLDAHLVQNALTSIMYVTRMMTAPMEVMRLVAPYVKVMNICVHRVMNAIALTTNAT